MVPLQFTSVDCWMSRATNTMQQLTDAFVRYEDALAATIDRMYENADFSAYHNDSIATKVDDLAPILIHRREFEEESYTTPTYVDDWVLISAYDDSSASWQDEF